MPYDFTDTEMAVRFLRKKNRRRYYSSNSSKNLRIRYPATGRHREHLDEYPSGFAVLYKRKGFWLLNMDIPSAMTERKARELRAWVESLCDREGITTVPVSERALAAMTRMNQNTNKPLHLVHRSGYECVFKIGANYYLSGYDKQEDPPLYFLCRLPKAAFTVDHAREILKPRSVIQAESQGMQVRRQGDIFFIRVGAVHVKEPELYRYLYGTNHVAERTHTLPTGVMLVNGCVAHKPENRAADHHEIYLEGWWVAVRNTVPATAEKPSEPKAGAQGAEAEEALQSGVASGWGFLGYMGEDDYEDEDEFREALIEAFRGIDTSNTSSAEGRESA